MGGNHLAQVAVGTLLGTALLAPVLVIAFDFGFASGLFCALFVIFVLHLSTLPAVANEKLQQFLIWRISVLFAAEAWWWFLGETPAKANRQPRQSAYTIACQYLSDSPRASGQYLEVRNFVASELEKADGELSPQEKALIRDAMLVTLAAVSAEKQCGNIDLFFHCAVPASPTFSRDSFEASSTAERPAFQIAADYILARQRVPPYIVLRNHTESELGRPLTSLDKDAIREAILLEAIKSEGGEHGGSSKGSEASKGSAGSEGGGSMGFTSALWPTWGKEIDAGGGSSSSLRADIVRGRAGPISPKEVLGLITGAGAGAGAGAGIVTEGVGAGGDARGEAGLTEPHRVALRNMRRFFPTQNPSDLVRFLKARKWVFESACKVLTVMCDVPSCVMYRHV
jgi:hypothetical protein